MKKNKLWLLSLSKKKLTLGRGKEPNPTNMLAKRWADASTDTLPDKLKVYSGKVISFASFCV